jgi:hypothetical protein
MRKPFHQLAFLLYKLFIRPTKRTPGRWSAIIFNDQNRFAVEQGSVGQRLPSGLVKPGYAIPHLCRNELGLNESCFASEGALRLIGVDGTVGECFVFYYAGEIIRGVPQVRRFEDKVSWLEKSELGSFIPGDIDVNLGTNFSKPTASKDGVPRLILLRSRCAGSRRSSGKTDFELARPLVHSAARCAEPLPSTPCLSNLNCETKESELL